MKKKLSGLSDIRRYFHRNDTPYWFVSATPFNLLGIDTIYQQIVQGLLIMLAVGLDQLLRRRR